MMPDLNLLSVTCVRSVYVAPDLNLLSWSTNNHLAVALGQNVYLWNASSGSITELMGLENVEDYVSSLAWVKEGNILAVGNSSGTVQVRDSGAIGVKDECTTRRLISFSRILIC